MDRRADAERVLMETVDEFITDHGLPPEHGMLLRQCVYAAAQTHDILELITLPKQELAARLFATVRQTLQASGAIPASRSTDLRGSQRRHSALH